MPRHVSRSLRTSVERIPRQRAQLAVDEDPAPLRAPATPCRPATPSSRAQRERAARRPAEERARRVLAHEAVDPRSSRRRRPARGAASSTCASMPGARRARAPRSSPPMPPPTTASLSCRGADDSSRTAVTIARTCSGSVSGSTPWPRLKMCRCVPARARMSATRARISAGGANSAPGSRLPCSATPSPTRRRTSRVGEQGLKQFGPAQCAVLDRADGTGQGARIAGANLINHQSRRLGFKLFQCKAETG